MLVLTRKTQQQIHIGNDITITILQVKGQAVRVGIEAPRNVNVWRAELDQKVEACEEISAAAAKGDSQNKTPKAASTGSRRDRSAQANPAMTGSPLQSHVVARRAPSVERSPESNGAERLGPAPRSLSLVV